MLRLAGGSKASVQSLTFLYTGASGAVSVGGIGSVSALTGDSIVVSITGVRNIGQGAARHSGGGGGSNSNKLPTNTVFTWAGGSATLHTSCSQDIFIGQVKH